MPASDPLSKVVPNRGDYYTIADNEYQKQMEITSFQSMGVLAVKA